MGYESSSVHFLALAHGDSPAFHTVSLSQGFYLYGGVGAHRQEPNERGAWLALKPRLLQVEYHSTRVPAQREGGQLLVTDIVAGVLTWQTQPYSYSTIASRSGVHR